MEAFNGSLQQLKAVHGCPIEGCMLMFVQLKAEHRWLISVAEQLVILFKRNS